MPGRRGRRRACWPAGAAADPQPGDQPVQRRVRAVPVRAVRGPAGRLRHARRGATARRMHLAVAAQMEAGADARRAGADHRPALPRRGRRDAGRPRRRRAARLRGQRTLERAAAAGAPALGAPTEAAGAPGSRRRSSATPGSWRPAAARGDLAWALVHAGALRRGCPARGRGERRLVRDLGTAVGAALVAARPRARGLGLTGDNEGALAVGRTLVGRSSRTAPDERPGATAVLSAVVMTALRPTWRQRPRRGARPGPAGRAEREPVDAVAGALPRSASHYATQGASPQPAAAAGVGRHARGSTTTRRAGAAPAQPDGRTDLPRTSTAAVDVGREAVRCRTAAGAVDLESFTEVNLRSRSAAGRWESWRAPLRDEDAPVEDDEDLLRVGAVVAGARTRPGGSEPGLRGPGTRTTWSSATDSVDRGLAARSRRWRRERRGTARTRAGWRSRGRRACIYAFSRDLGRLPSTCGRSRSTWRMTAGDDARLRAAAGDRRRRRQTPLIPLALQGAPAADRRGPARTCGRPAEAVERLFRAGRRRPHAWGSVATYRARAARRAGRGGCDARRARRRARSSGSAPPRLAELEAARAWRG